MPPKEELSSTTLIGWLLATLGGLSALLYLSGVLALTMRLVFYGLPFETAIADLPQNFVVTVALVEMLMPSLAVVGAYLLFRAVVRPVHTRSQSWKRARHWLASLPRHRSLVTAGGVFVWITILGYYLVVQKGQLEDSYLFWLAGLVVALAISLTATNLHLRCPRP